MKAIILARVSTEDQMQEGQSIPAQLQRAREYCQRKALDVQSEHQFDESSLKDKRKKFELVIDEIRKSKQAVALVVETVDRLQRSFKESVLLDEFRKSGKLELHFIRENLIIHKDSNSSEIQRWDLGVFTAKSFVLQISDNVKRTFELKRRNGEWTGRATIGYLNVNKSDTEKDVIPDPDKAYLLQKLFELYATASYSMKNLRDEMHKLGLRSVGNKSLSVSMIDFILKNPFYYGEMRSKGKFIPHKYKPIITKELFDRCQAVKQNWGKKPFQYGAKPFIFRGLLRCARCGCSMSPETHKGRYTFYACTNARKEICSKKVYVPEADLLKPVYELLEAFSFIPEDAIQLVVEELKKSNEAKNLYHRSAIQSLRAEYDTTQTRIDRLLDVLLDGSITKDDYDKKLKSLKERQYELNLQLEEHTRADENYYITVSNVFNLAKNALGLFKSSEVPEKRALLNFLLQNSLVEGKKLTFELRKPFDLLLKVPLQELENRAVNPVHPVWLRGKDLNLDYLGQNQASYR